MATTNENRFLTDDITKRFHNILWKNYTTKRHGKTLSNYTVHETKYRFQMPTTNIIYSHKIHEMAGKFELQTNKITDKRL